MDMAKKKVEERKTTVKATEDEFKPKKRITKSSQKEAGGRTKGAATVMPSGSKLLAAEKELTTFDTDING